MKRKGGRKTIGTKMILDKRDNRRLNHDNSVVADLLQKFNLKKCFIKLESIDGVMEQQQPVARKPGRPGRKPKVNNATATPTTPAAPTSNAANADDESVAPDTTTAGDTPVAATPDRKASPVTAAEKSTTAKKAAKKVEDVTVLSGGRGKRTPKPNPRYMNEATVSLTKTSIKDDSADSETNDEENDEVLSSDDYRTPSDMPLKKRNLHQKLLQKSATTTITAMATTAGSAKKLTATGKVTPGVNVTRKTPVPAKRKLNAEADIDIDDDHGKQLFLAAKRRLTHVSCMSIVYAFHCIVICVVLKKWLT